MSEERRKRQQERLGVGEADPRLRKFMIVGGILVLLAAAYTAGWYHRNHRYDAMAKCMASRQVKMFGAYWCPHCADQKEILANPPALYTWNAAFPVRTRRQSSAPHKA